MFHEMPYWNAKIATFYVREKLGDLYYKDKN